MKKIIIIIIIGMLMIGGLMAVSYVFNLSWFAGEDSWICVNGEWIKHGNPSAPKPDRPCGKTQPKVNDIIVSQPQSNDCITSPLVVTGEARGWWYFEGDFPLHLEDATGQILSQGVAQAQSDWMTENFVPFTATLIFSTPTTASGTLVLEKDNPSGLLENAAEIRIPVRFASTETMTVQVYFGNTQKDPKVLYCERTYPTPRVITRTQAVARAALTELLAGLTDEEKNQGFFTSLNSGVTINSLTIENGIAKVDFDEQLNFQVGGSCRVTTIRSQIEETLKQFPTVSSVIISVNGQTENILEP